MKAQLFITVNGEKIRTIIKFGLILGTLGFRLDQLTCGPVSCTGVMGGGMD